MICVDNDVTYRSRFADDNFPQLQCSCADCCSLGLPPPQCSWVCGLLQSWAIQCTTLACSACFGWDRVNFLHSSWYGAMFWICAENSVDNSGMFSLLLSSAYTASRPFLLLTPPHQRVGWGCTRSWEGTQLGQLTPTDKRGIPCHMTSCQLTFFGF